MDTATSTWHWASHFDTIEEARAVYRLIEAIICAPPAPDLSGYCCLDDGQPTVIVLAHTTPPPCDPARLSAVEVLMGRGHRVQVDPALLQVLLADWATKHGYGPPIITRDRWEAITYQREATS
jgi:hypothetical protein